MTMTMTMTMPHFEQVEGRARRALDRATYERYLPLVRRIAMRIVRRVPAHVTAADLVSCGWLGLMEAYSRARPEMPPQEFEAYASYRIRGAILDYLRSTDMVSREMRKTSRALARAIKDLTRELGRAPSEDEIAARLGMTEESYRETLAKLAQAGMARLELFDPDDADARFETEVEAVDERAARQELSAEIAAAIEQLPSRLQTVLSLYYQHECTLREVGAVLGVSESRASQLHTEALHRLRAAVGGE
jgi:RNA polymerase sigma factor FliA